MNDSVAARLDIQHLCTVDLNLRPVTTIGQSSRGNRLIAEIAGMSLKGARIDAELHGVAAADWLTIANKVAVIDVRATVKTRDDAVIYVQYRGRADVSEGLGKSPIIVAPVFETSDERYLWLNAIQAIGKGNLATRRYEWFEVL